MEGCSLTLVLASRKTLVEMLSHRGYIFDIDILTIINNPSLQIKCSNSDNTVKVAYILNKRHVPLLKEYIAKNCSRSKTTSTNVKHIIVTQYKVNKPFLTLCNQYSIENFSIQSLGVNITKHSLVPEHVLYSTKNHKKEREELKQNLSINTWSTLPIMHKTDPVAKYYGAEEGDIFKITRNSKTAGKYVSFRYIV